MQAYCKICNEGREVKGDLDPRQVLIPLECGHTFNFVNGDCYTEEQLKDREAILCDTITRLIGKAKESQKKALDAVQDII